MPKVTVVLKNGSKIEIEGANDAHWETGRTAEGTNLGVVLIVQFTNGNVTETRGKFRGEEIAGYALDQR